MGIVSVPGDPVLVSLPDVEINPPRLGRLAILGPADGPVPEHDESPIARWKPNPRPKIVPTSAAPDNDDDDDEILESWSSDLVEVVKVAERWSHTVQFNDDIAADHDDLIEAYVDQVKKRRWVRAAAWEDREVVILKARRLSAKPSAKKPTSGSENTESTSQLPTPSAGSRRIPNRSARALRAAYAPPKPCTPGPGRVDAEQM